MKSMVIAAAFVAFAGLSVPKPVHRSAEPVVFSILLTTTPTGWAAKCDTGCRWKELAFSCRSACPAIVDANGVVTLASPRPEPTPFSFTLRHEHNGAEATSRGGTAWKTLTWDCRESPCQVRLTETGVGASR
jgi:hypothetical protein